MQQNKQKKPAIIATKPMIIHRKTLMILSKTIKKAKVQQAMMTATKIATQEWIALFGQGFETWTEWRRTQIPQLTPAAEAIITKIPSRLFYPTTEPSLNKANYDAAVTKISADELTSTLFWQ